MSNLDLWNKLGRTDPAHTKGFKRAGGFGGTAIKPIYTEQKMTEEFGPCGTGWGFSEPVFQTVAGSEGQIAVYCWLSLWYVLDGKKSDPVPGVGGDMVVIKQSNGLRTDDEAFKKAFTDAIGNAMKHIGMSADVHMGLFDDSKYVNEVRAEIVAEQKPADAPKGLTVAVLKENYTRLKKELLEQQSQGWRVMAQWLNNKEVLAEIEALGRYAEDFKGEAREIFDLAKAGEEAFDAVMPVTARGGAAVEPNFDGLEP